MIVIRDESGQDQDAIWNVHCKAFGTEAEANLVNELRRGEYVEVSQVAESENTIVGHTLYSRISIHTSNGLIDALSLAPMAVLPSFQRQGIGSQLIESSLLRCKEHGHKIVLVLGHPDYYSRFGFSATLAEPLISPFGGGDAWMALELVEGALSGIEGTVQYPPPFGNFE